MESAHQRKQDRSVLMQQLHGGSSAGNDLYMKESLLYECTSSFLHNKDRRAKGVTSLCRLHMYTGMYICFVVLMIANLLESY